MPPTATSAETSVAIEAFVRLVRAHVAVTRQLSDQLSADHGLNINAYEALLRLARAPDSRMRRVDLANGLLLTASGVHSNNGTKSTPSLQADILGDWREEVIWPTTDNTKLRIYSTTDATSISHVSLMQDRMYREAVAWQNTAYNQPPHPSFALGG